MKIGAIAESFRKPFKEAIAQIATLKLDGVQMYADTRTVNADMTLLQIKEIKNILDGYGIKISALCGDLGCGMYYTKDRATIDKEKRIMEIAKELGLENTEAVKTRVEEMKGSFDYVVSRAVTELSLFYPWVKDKYKKSILYLKGGDIAVEVELAAHKCKIRRELIEVTDISRFFKDEYFTGKRIVEIKR